MNFNREYKGIKMNSFRQYVQITSEKLIIDFPSNFYKGRALLEITPLPEAISEKNMKSNNDNFRKLLLQRPSSLKKEEIENINKISLWMKEWKPENY